MNDEFDDITTPEEFQRALSELVSAAVENGVEVEGGWTCKANPSGDRWDIVISELGSGGDSE